MTFNCSSVNRRVYLNILLILLQFSGDKIALSAGPKKYNFSLQLAPSNGRDLPGSLKHSNGFILYQIVVSLKQQLQSYKQAEKEIMVRGYYNLSTSGDKGLQNPVVLGKSGVTFRLNKSAYLIGTDMKLV